MPQLLAHLWGDYITQSDWMAQNKRHQSWPCFIHCLLYTAPFGLITESGLALLVIFFTHFLIDRFGVARYVVYIKNLLGPDFHEWTGCSATGYPPERPPWLSVWLLIIADNILHLTINYLAITHL